MHCGPWPNATFCLCKLECLANLSIFEKNSLFYSQTEMLARGVCFVIVAPVSPVPFFTLHLI